MAVPGRQEQTLVYRVELDESSVAQIIRTARESVGIGLQQAGGIGSSVLGMSQLTASTAVAQVGSHLEFLRQAKSALDAPIEMQRSATGMSIATALGVRAGMVDPRFSELKSSLESRANATLGDPYGTGGLKVMGGVAQTALLALGVGSMFLGPVGWAGTAAIMGAEMGLDAGISSSIDRAVGRRELASHLRHFGVRRSMAISRQFEEDISGFSGSYDDLKDVASAALSNTRVRPGQDVNSMLLRAVGDWRVAGKMLGVEKEDALNLVGEMYRAGMQPGSVQGYLGRVGAVSHMMGFDPTAVNAHALSFARQASVEGYDSFAASNHFMLQSGMIGQMVREGVISRNQLTAAAGFSGPEGEQIMAAAKNIIGQTMAFTNTGFGRAISLGTMAGARGNVNAVLGSAMGATTQELLGFEASSRSTENLMAVQAATAGVASQVIKGAGGTVTESTLTSTLMRMGFDYGSAQVMAQQELNPGMRGVQNMAARRMELEAALETSGRAGVLEEMGTDIARHGADVAGNLYSGYGSRRMLGGPTAWIFGEKYTLNPTAWAMGAFDSEGNSYRGLRGVGRFASDVFDTTVGEFVRDVGEVFGEVGRGIGSLFGYQRESSGRGRAMGTFLTRGEIEGESISASRANRRSVDRLRAEYDVMFSSDPKAVRSRMFTSFLHDRQQQVMKDVLDSSMSRREQFTKDGYLLQDELGVQLNDDDLSGLLMQTERFRRRLDGASTSDAREAVMGDFRGTLRSIGALRGVNIDQAAELLLDRTQTRFTRSESDRLMALMDAEGRSNAFNRAVGSSGDRARLAKRLFSEGSSFAKELEDAEGITESQFNRMLSRAFSAGDIRRGVATAAKELTAGGRSFAEAATQQILSEYADDVKMARGAKEKEAEGAKDVGPDAGAAGRDIGSLVTTLNETNRLLRDLVERGDMRGK